MSREHYGKIWTFVGTVLLYYALNTWIVTQGGNEIFETRLISGNRAPASVIAILICSFLLVVVCVIGRLYARSGGALWHERIPVVALRGLRTGSTEGKWYQKAVFFCFTILPIAALIHFWDLVRDAKVISDATKKPVGLWDWSVTFQSWSDPARICSIYVETDPDPCKGSGTFLPGVEMIGLVIFSAAALLAFISYIWVLATPGGRSIDRP